jgi:hypothetical protein
MSICFPSIGAIIKVCPSRILESVESIVGIADEWQILLCILFGWNSFGQSLMGGSRVHLGNILNGKVADVHIRSELGLKRRSDTSELVPDYSSEKGMSLDLGSSIVGTTFSSNSIVGITEETDQVKLATFQRKISLPFTFGSYALLRGPKPTPRGNTKSRAS